MHISQKNIGPTTDTFIYYLWYSLITQTTVGYMGLIDTHGQNIPWAQNHFWPYKIINYTR